MTRKTTPTQAEIEALLDSLAESGPEPSDALVARVMEDALARQSQVWQPRQRDGFLSQLFSALGGWGGLGGLVAATCAGVYVGVSPPDGLLNTMNLVWVVDQQEAFDAAPGLTGFGWLLEEEGA
ncbi:MAG: hypothetical protein AAFY74_11290 [Pseudomonadota bacterium]